jgi:hypothetical protein
VLALSICIAAFLASFWSARRSVGMGIGMTLVSGYSYGLIRANVTETGSHFIFDAAVVGLYIAILVRPRTRLQRRKIRKLLPWFLLLFAWPFLMLAVPFQDPIIQLVGFRAQVFFLPCLLIGAMMDDVDVQKVAYWLCALNLIAFGFGVAEYLLGIEKFIPLNDATRFIYLSNDVATGTKGGTAVRIPSTFVSAAGYGGVMVLSVPWIAGAFSLRGMRGWPGVLFAATLFAVVLGVFLSASRTQAILLIALTAVLLFSMRAKIGTYSAFIVIIGAATWFVMQNPRLQRFKTIHDTTYVETRIESSANTSFFDAAENHPLGIGLGAAGTSIPAFLQYRIDRSKQIVIENEYARIMLEQGLPGLIIWLAFITWVLTRAAPRPNDNWLLSRRLAYVTTTLFLGTGIIGLGLFNWIPGTLMLFLMMGWISAARVVPISIHATNAPALDQRTLGPLAYGNH